MQFGFDCNFMKGEGGGRRLIEEIRWNLIVQANYLFGGGKDR